MLIPNNEGKACNAVVRDLEKSTRQTRADFRVPECDGIGPPVGLRLRPGEREYAIEHTRIELFENQLGSLAVAKRLVDHVKSIIPDPFPGPAWHLLLIPPAVPLPGGRASWVRAGNSPVEWIRSMEKTLRELNRGRIPLGHYPHVYKDSIRGKPDGFDCEIEFWRWPSAELIGANPGELSFGFIPPEYTEGPFMDMLRRTFEKKMLKTEGLQN